MQHTLLSPAKRVLYKGGPHPGETELLQRYELEVVSHDLPQAVLRHLEIGWASEGQGLRALGFCSFRVSGPLGLGFGPQAHWLA